MTRPREREFWERLVRQVEAGESQAEVARRHGVGSSSVGHWVRRVQRERAGGAPTSAMLLPVRVTGEAARRVEVAVGGYRLSFEEGADPGYVAAVARALAAC